METPITGSGFPGGNGFWSFNVFCGATTPSSPGGLDSIGSNVTSITAISVGGVFTASSSGAYAVAVDAIEATWVQPCNAGPFDPLQTAIYIQLTIGGDNFPSNGYRIPDYEAQAGTYSNPPDFFTQGAFCVLAQGMCAQLTFQVPDSDDDGVDDVADICPDTVIDDPTKRLGKNRWMWDGGEWVTTESNGGGPDKSFTMEETKGCSCEQILDTLVDKTDRPFDGHYKFGCSSSVVEDWISGRYYMETVDVQAADDVAVASDMTLKSGENYHLLASGVADALNATDQHIPFDAKYSVTTQPPANQLETNPADWTDLVTLYEIEGTQLLDLHVDGANIDWGAFNPAHVYWYDMPGTGAPVSLLIYDVYYPNNAGLLSVDIFVKLW